jgi:predicted membrane protein
MDNFSIIFVLFVRAGFAFAAAVLVTAYWLAPRLRPSLAGLSRVAGGLLAFYALCTLMIDGVAIIRTAALWRYVTPVLLPLLAIIVLFLTIRKWPQWLPVPFALLINFSLIRAVCSGQWGGDDQLLVQLWSVKPYILLLMGLLFLLLVFVLYLLGIWFRRILQESDVK